MLVAYEIIITLVFIGFLLWSIRSANACYLGALFGGYMLAGFDWIWCTAGFWNATFNSELTMIPGLNIRGVQYPYTIGFLWSIGFGFLPLLASRFYGVISQKLGALHLPTVFVAAVITDMVVEIICVHLMGLWTYHQQPEFLFFSWNWSNAWFLGGILTASYYGMAYAKKWGVLPDTAGIHLTRDSTWQGLLVPVAAILAPAGIFTSLQLFWFSAMEPWVASGRPF